MAGGQFLIGAIFGKDFREKQRALLEASGGNKKTRNVDKVLSDEGFELHGVHEYLPELIMPKGILGKVKPTDKHLKDINQVIGEKA